MLTTDKTQVQIALGFLDTCTHPNTGFLPSRAPLHTLPGPFVSISEACRELVGNYAGDTDNCRPWLEGEFTQIPSTWKEATESADEHVLDALMTQVSLLCHAYICGNANGVGLAAPALPPAGIDELWSLVAKKLDVPKVGNFFALITSNWTIDGIESGRPYDFTTLEGKASKVSYPWLAEPLVIHLHDFLGFFLEMEARGHRLVEIIADLLNCILQENEQEATYHMMLLSANIASLTTDFNKAFKKSKSAPEEFEREFKPTLVLGDEDGASGLQSCSFQLLESFFGLDPESEYGSVVLEARQHMNSERRKLLKVLDLTSVVVRSFVETSRSPRLLEAFNRCITHLKTWRLLYVKRGSLLSKTQKNTPIVTQTPLLEGDWQEREWSLDSLFRFLPEDQRQAVVERSEQLEFEAGETIILEGDLFPGLFELQSGTASVLKGGVEQNEVVDTIGLGEVFGEMSLVENLPASANIVADVALSVRHLSLEAVYDLMNENREAEGGFYLALAQLISHRLRHAFPENKHNT